jgi:hypothetical protein
MNLWLKLQRCGCARRLVGLVILLGVCGGLAEPWSPAVSVARAEGSRTLYPAEALGHRGNIEWRTSFMAIFCAGVPCSRESLAYVMLI